MTAAVLPAADRPPQPRARTQLRALDFVLPGSLEATEPPEARCLERDQVRLLVARRHDLSLEHSTVRHLPDFLEPGDLLVVNNSATLPAALSARSGGRRFELHLSTRLRTDVWVIEPRVAGDNCGCWTAASEPFPDATSGTVFDLADQGRVQLLRPYGTPGRLWVALVRVPRPMPEWLAAHGQPIRYRYVARSWPLDYYQTVFAQEPGSAEMPSAARPFSAALVTELVSRGVGVSPITLHCGVSSQEEHEAPYAEWFEVPSATADLVNQTRERGSRVVAVGTTVVRALESALDSNGQVQAARRWTDLVVTGEGLLGSVDGMITGWHEPRASHLAMLEAVAGHDLLARSYECALDAGYLWHEFGDSHLILP